MKRKVRPFIDPHFWHCPEEWKDEVAFVVAGGPSVRDIDTERLRGRKVIVINSSYERVPFADFLFFGDRRWFVHHQKDIFRTFAGRVVTGSRMRSHRIYSMGKVKPPPGITRKRHQIVYQRTSLQGAINLAVHLVGQNGRIVLLGADMQRSPEGVTHHHTPHPWPTRPGAWDKQMQELRLAEEPLKNYGVEVVNCSEKSRIDWWRKMTFEDALAW